MHYVVFDLEFNQDLSSFQEPIKKVSRYPFEIIQIGAVKLDSKFDTIATFNCFVKPTIYENISPFITELTGIISKQLEFEETFPSVYESYLDFIGRDDDIIFCIWGMSDMKELFHNVDYHELNSDLLPRKYINIQPYVSIHLGHSPKNLLRLQNAVEALNIPITVDFHNALSDAYYTAELLKQVYHPAMKPSYYDPHYVKPIERQPRKVIDEENLILQFEKMYERNMSEEEKAMILLAYKMGKTNQFLKFIK